MANLRKPRIYCIIISIESVTSGAFCWVISRLVSFCLARQQRRCCSQIKILPPSLSLSLRTDKQTSTWTKGSSDPSKETGKTVNPIYSWDVTGHPRRQGSLDINATVLTQAACGRWGGRQSLSWPCFYLTKRPTASCAAICYRSQSKRDLIPNHFRNIWQGYMSRLTSHSDWRHETSEGTWDNSEWLIGKGMSLLCQRESQTPPQWSGTH